LEVSRNNKNNPVAEQGSVVRGWLLLGAGQAEPPDRATEQGLPQPQVRDRGQGRGQQLEPSEQSPLALCGLRRQPQPLHLRHRQQSGVFTLLINPGTTLPIRPEIDTHYVLLHGMFAAGNVEELLENLLHGRSLEQPLCLDWVSFRLIKASSALEC